MNIFSDVGDVIVDSDEQSTEKIIDIKTQYSIMVKIKTEESGIPC